MSGVEAPGGTRLFADGERLKISYTDVEAMFTPGHTPASVAHVAGGAAFIHDTVSMRDRDGPGRT